MTTVSIMSPVIASLVLITTVASGIAADDYIRRPSWTTFTGGSLNISAFAFRDVDRDGVYDLSDFPMAGIAFDAVGSGRTITRRTNKSGFGNFTMSVLERNSDIVNIGDYVFEARIPRGWQITSGNGRQSSRLDLMPGAPADMISTNPLQPVGLAPELRLFGFRSGQDGTIGPRITSADVDDSLPATSPDGLRMSVPLDPKGFFSLLASPGTWTVQRRRPDGSRAEQRVEVAASPVQLGPIPTSRSPATPRATVEASFDDLVGAGIKEIPNGYAGLSWRNWVVTHNKFYDGEGYVNATTTGEFVAYNSSGHPVRIESPRPFDFLAGDFGAAWLRAEGETLRIKAWRGGELAYSEDVELSAFGPVRFVAGFEDITAIEFRTAHYWQFVSDSLVFSIAD